MPRILRATLVALGALLAIYAFGRVLDGHYPIRTWIFWKYAKAIGLAAFWALSCAMLGLAVTRRLVPLVPLRERLVQAAACGVYAFYVLQFLGGMFGWFGPAWAIVLPSAMLVGGALDSRELLGRVWLHRRLLPTFTFGVSRSWQIPVAILGIASLVGLYFAILTPENASFDSAWYHLGLGQGWAAAGGISRSPEGWFVEALPHLAAVVYSWAFIVPGLDLFERAMVAAHIELALFLMTLASIPVLVRWLLPGARVGISWVAFFLFPAIYIYDASLHSGNDHVAAFWAVPIFLAFRRAWTALETRHLALAAMTCAGALLTKYQAASLVVAPVLFLSARSAYLAFETRDASLVWRGVGLGAVMGLALTTPLWLKNWIWYGDPLFPALSEYFTPRPWNDDMPSVMQDAWARLVRRPEGTFVDKLAASGRAAWEFSFVSSTRGRFHGAWPYVGSLFTLSLLWLPFVRGAKRTWALFVAAQIGVLFWFNFSQVERYLQALVPWMASVVAAALVLGWRTGWIARVPIVGLVLLQVIWGGDAYFIRSHSMVDDLPVVHSARLIESGYKRRLSVRQEPFGALQRIGDQLPDDAKVLLHGKSRRLGLQAEVLTDVTGFQSLFRYGLMASPREIFDLYRSLGVTHIVWNDERIHGFDTLAGDLRFHDFVTNEVTRTGKEDALAWGPLPSTAPSEAPRDAVLYLGCLPAFAPGLYRLEELHVADDEVGKAKPFQDAPMDPIHVDALAEESGFLVYGPACRPRRPRPSTAGFVRAGIRKGEEIWIRRR